MNEQTYGGNESKNNNESIQLSLPMNAAYVSAARLTASSIANRMVFDIDEIEDVKAAVSEACTFIIQHVNAEECNEFMIVFELAPGELTIKMKVKGMAAPKLWENEMGLVMIRAFMDQFEIVGDDREFLTMIMVKRHKEISFD